MIDERREFMAHRLRNEERGNISFSRLGQDQTTDIQPTAAICRHTAKEERTSSEALKFAVRREILNRIGTKLSLIL